MPLNLSGRHAGGVRRRPHGRRWVGGVVVGDMVRLALHARLYYVVCAPFVAVFMGAHTQSDECRRHVADRRRRRENRASTFNSETPSEPFSCPSQGAWSITVEGFVPGLRTNIWVAYRLNE